MLMKRLLFQEHHTLMLQCSSRCLKWHQNPFKLGDLPQMGTGSSMTLAIWGLTACTFDEDPTGIENFEELKKRTRGDGTRKYNEDATKAIALRLAHMEAKTVEEYQEIKQKIE